ncbi:MAG TPA: hypothetical protein VFK43_10045 [Acidimicrobiales bacterium]|nr:hypothetical protein [Acidimicrobiales bacterium]
MTTRIPRQLARAGAAAAMAVLAAACGGGDDTKTITAADYSFQNLPKQVDAGTTFKLENSSTKELHELVMVRIPDSETRPVSELVKLPQAEVERLLAGEPAMVLLRPPGSPEQINAVGDGKITEKGRYAVICAIPTGADPAAYLAAAQSSQGGPPNVPGGPPHFVQGMFGEIKVK